MKHLDTLIWVCIYGGLLPQAMTFFLEDGTLVQVIRIGGAVLLALGVIFWLVRSRRP